MVKILIVEDDPMVSDIYEKKFSACGFEVITADSGEKALEEVEKSKPDVAMVDIVMPGMDGFQVIKKMKEGGHNPEMKIIACSNLSQEEDQAKALELGADKFIAKSGRTPSELVEDVRKITCSEWKEEPEEKPENLIDENTARFEGEKIGYLGKVLIVEDEDPFAFIFSKKFEQEGFEAQAVPNGEAGIKKISEEKFDLFVINLSVPLVSGRELIEKIKSEESLKNIPIIALTFSEEDDVSKEKELGVEKFFVKTKLTPAELIKEAKNLLGNQ